MTLEARKYKLIKSITELDNERIINQLEKLLYQLNKEDNVLFRLTKPMREKLDIGTLMKEQNYKHPSKTELEEIITEANIEEPIDELIKMI